MKKQLYLSMLLAGLVMPQSASAALFDTVIISTGYSDDFGTPIKLGLRKDLHFRWFEGDTGYLSQYIELSINHFTDPRRPATAIAISPVFIYHFKTKSEYKPFIEFGTGFSYFSKKNVGLRRSGTNFQFEDRVGAGFRKGKHDWTFRYIHYSNANIDKPNDGLDMVMLNYGYRF